MGSRNRQRDRRSNIIVSDDSDEDSNVSPPPRDIGIGDEHVAEGDGTVEMLKLPTQWSEGDRHKTLSVSADGRELNYTNGDFSSYIAFLFYSLFYIHI